jgi:hypothetical protein
MTEIVNLGWNNYFAAHFVDGGDFTPARVIAEHRTGYRVQAATGEFPARVSGRLRHEVTGHAELPKVGDWVEVPSPVDGGEVT